LEESRLETAIFPPAISIDSAIRSAGNAKIIIGAQNIYFEEKGAFTGEISAPMLAETGCTHVLIGHSERRHIFNENNIMLNQKIKAAQSSAITPVYCVGELLDERRLNKTFEIIKEQIVSGLACLEPSTVKEKLIIAYEPVWAIGTGLTAGPDDAQEVCAFIRQVIAEMFDNCIADNILILYGGSVKPENTALLMSKKDIDGALVGGASLDPESFAAILEAAL
ncbi:MAG: triose-phosphate isomerase, partial [Angelakisella sp.]